MGYIYLIKNKINNKNYVGQTIRENVNERWKEHKYKKGCPLLKNAIKSHGILNFDFKIIIICFDSDLNFYEEFYIKKYNSLYPNGYNLLKGGEQNNLSEFNNKKIYQYDKDGKFLNEYKSLKEAGNLNKLSAKNISKCASSKRSKTCGNFIWKYEKCDISDEEKINKTYKKIFQYDINGKFIKEYKNINEASQINNISRNKISECANGKLELGDNYIWSFFKDININLNRKFRRDLGVKKRIMQLDLENYKILAEYSSILEASRSTNIPKSTISRCLKGNKKAGGFLWEYKN